MLLKAGDALINTDQVVAVVRFEYENTRRLATITNVAVFISPTLTDEEASQAIEDIRNAAKFPPIAEALWLVTPSWVREVG